MKLQCFHISVSLSIQMLQISLNKCYRFLSTNVTDFIQPMMPQFHSNEKMIQLLPLRLIQFKTIKSLKGHTSYFLYIFVT